MTTLTNTEAFPLSTAKGFTRLYGIPVVAIEEDCGTLLMLGHPDERSILAVTAAQYRLVYGQRILPGRELDELIPFGVKKTWARAVPRDGYCPWHTELTGTDAEHALPITLVSVDWLEAEDVAVQEQCPVCGRASRTSDIASTPGRSGYSRVRTCRHCHTRWPSVDAYRVSLYKLRKPGGIDPAACFGCGCTPAWTCSPGCQMSDNPPITQPLCTTCQAPHNATTWQALTDAGYASPASDEQRDRWLYTQALRGTHPTTAATAWTERRALVRCRALAATARDRGNA
ncbi:hypothetical protein OG625_39960 (plasmid) [Streptomyces sp. NBC_01351]|uniref:hypothetical protein n=1 Tax=Streptomyces sp. NBC_01351 TaxID=2903833 RepID=UPI002E336096|nr:hypothetical protein [Streptomyces sp. NBC_01351]